MYRLTNEEIYEAEEEIFIYLDKETKKYMHIYFEGVLDKLHTIVSVLPDRERAFIRRTIRRTIYKYFNNPLSVFVQFSERSCFAK